MTFEDSEDETAINEDDRIKVLRLKEGTDYDVQIVGTGRGMMDYTIGFMQNICFALAIVCTIILSLVTMY